MLFAKEQRDERVGVLVEPHGRAVAAEKQVVVRRGHRLARRIIVPIEDEACLPKQGQEK